TLHPKMSLELDLGLDSLGRAEVFAALEAALETDLNADDAAKALTVSDAIDLVNEYGKGSELLSANAGDIESAVDVHWGKLVRTADETLPEIQPILKRRPLFG